MSNNKSTTRAQSRTVQRKVDVQEVANMAARTVLNEFANSPERKDELRSLMQEAITHTLDKFGLDPDDKEAVDKFRANMVHLNTWREFAQLVRAEGIAAATGWFMKGLLAVIALGLLALFSGWKLPGLSGH